MKLSGYPDQYQASSTQNAPVISGVTPPGNAGEGTLWMNTTDPKNPVLNVYHNGAWVTAAGKFTEQMIQDLIDQSIQLNQKVDETEFVETKQVSQTGGSPNIIPETDASGKLDPSFIPGGIVDLMPYAKATDTVLKTDLVDTTHGVTDAGKAVKLDAQGFIDTSMLKIGGGMNYKGPANPTAGNAPVGAAVGDFYVATVDGVGAVGWPGLSTVPILKGEAVIFDGTNWTIVGASVNAATVYTKTESDTKYYDKTAVDNKFGEAVDFSAGPTSAGKLIKLAASGLIDPSMIPPLGGTGNMNWKGYMDAEGNAMPLGAKLGDTYMLARQFAAVESQELDIPLPGSPDVKALEVKYPWLPELHASMRPGKGGGLRDYSLSYYSAGTLLLVAADGVTWAKTMKDVAYVAKLPRPTPIRSHGPDDNVTGTGAVLLTPPVDVPDIITYYQFIMAEPLSLSTYYAANSYVTYQGQYLTNHFGAFGYFGTPHRDKPSPLMWWPAPAPSMAKHKVIKSSMDIETSLNTFTPITPGPTWKGVDGKSMTSGDVIVYDGAKWVNISPRVGRFVTMNQYKAGLAAGGTSSSTTSSSGVSTNVANEIVRVTELVEKFKEFAANTYETKSDLNAALKNEKATSDRTYQTIVQAQQDTTDAAKAVDTKYLSKADAANSYATSIDLQNHMQAEKARSDNLYETKVDANTAHAAETARADRLFIKNTEPIVKSNGPIDIDKLPKLGADGKLDPSFLPAVAGGAGGGMQYKGTTAPAVAPVTPAKGDMWVFATAGTLGATFAPLIGTVVKGDAIIFNGVSWDLISNLVDLSAYYTKAEIDAQVTAEKADIALAVANEKARADTTYQTIAKAGTDMTDERNRADSVYQTQVASALELSKKLNVADAANTYLSQVDAAGQYMSTAAYRADQLTVADNVQQTYETKLNVKRMLDGEVLRADTKYLDKTEAVAQSAGIADAGKIPKLNSVGKIDGSMLSIQGGMQLKGSIFPAITEAPGFPAAGWFYLVAGDGVMGPTWTGVAGTAVKQGDGLIFDGLLWSPLKMSTDLTDFFTKAESSALFASNTVMQKALDDLKAMLAATYETQTDAQAAHTNMLKQLSLLFLTPAQVATLIGAERGRADGAYQTKADAANMLNAATLAAKAAATDAATKAIAAAGGASTAGLTTAIAAEVTRADAAYLKIAGGTLTGTLTLNAAPAADLEAATKKYVDDQDTVLDKGIRDAVKAVEAAIIPKTDLVKTSTGVAEADKIPQLSADGKIDSSMIKLPGVLTLKGAKDPTVDVAPGTPDIGDTYIITKTGVPVASWGITGTVSAGSMLVRESATAWIALTSSGDLTGKVTKAGDTMLGPLILSGDPTSDLHAADKKYVDDQVKIVSKGVNDLVNAVEAAVVPLAGATMTGDLILNGAPTADLQAATKKYVDDLEKRVKLLEAMLVGIAKTTVDAGKATEVSTWKFTGVVEATKDITAFKP